MWMYFLWWCDGEILIGKSFCDENLKTIFFNSEGGVEKILQTQMTKYLYL